jgi:hypothetical protein
MVVRKIFRTEAIFVRVTQIFPPVAPSRINE